MYILFQWTFHPLYPLHWCNIQIKIIDHYQSSINIFLFRHIQQVPYLFLLDIMRSLCITAIENPSILRHAKSLHPRHLNTKSLKKCVSVEISSQNIFWPYKIVVTIFKMAHFFHIPNYDFCKQWLQLKENMLIHFPGIVDCVMKR